MNMYSIARHVWPVTINMTKKQEIFVFSQTFRPAVGPTQPRIQWVAVAVFPGVKRPGCEIGCTRLVLVQYKSAYPGADYPERQLFGSAWPFE